MGAVPPSPPPWPRRERPRDARRGHVVQFARSEFLYVTSRTRGSRDEQLDRHQKRQGSLWSQHNLYRDVVEPARESAGVSFTL